VVLAGRNLWLALAAAAVLGAVPGVLTCSTRKPEVVSVAADAGVAVSLDAGVQSKADCELTITHWQRVPVFAVGSAPATDAGATIQTSAPVQYVYLPDVRLTGHSESVATQQVEAQAGASASATVAKSASDAPYLILGAGLGTQHDDTGFSPTVNGRVGLGWGKQAVSLSGGVDPVSTQHWNASLGWELHW
jgi:hypothetical protein